VVPNSDLPVPKIPMPKPANNPDVVDDPIKHGEYLAQLMLCNHCHFTPGADMEPVGPDKMFSGGYPFQLMRTGVLYSPNITSDVETGIGSWTEDQIFKAIKYMMKSDGTVISAPMLLYQPGWAQLDDKDLRAVAAFIHSLPPVKNKVPAATGAPTSGFKADGAAPGSGSGSDPAAGSP